MDQSIFASALPGLLPAGIPKFAASFASHATGFAQLGQAYSAARTVDGDESFPQRLLRQVQVTYRLSVRDQKWLPRTGSAVVVANHPFGMLEAAVLASAMQQFRQDVRFLANGMLTRIPELADLIIPVDILGTNRDASKLNSAGMRRALEFLQQGGMLVMFPAGAVSHYHSSVRATIDPPWNPAIARLIEIASRRSKPVIVPVHVQGSNSFLFHAAGMVHPSLRTALLPLEFINKQGAEIPLRVGKPVDLDRLRMLPTHQQQIEYLRWRTYLLAPDASPIEPQKGAARTPGSFFQTFGKPYFAKRTHFDPNSRDFIVPALNLKPRFRASTPVLPALPSDLLEADIAELPPDAILSTSGNLQVCLTTAHQIPHVLQEIGRLRELTFRDAGEGTGKATDLDLFDEHYLHLFVWNTRKREVVGAYRIAPTDQVKHHSCLYTATLFRFDEAFLNSIGPSLELGRSFIRSEYQKGFAPLLLLWKGIGKFVARNPRYKMLFGPVSISNRYQALSRELMVAFLKRETSLSEWAGMVQGRNTRRPIARSAATAMHADRFCTDLEELSEVVSDIEPEHSGVPVLLRQYLRLGGKLLGFNVDPKFSNTLDGLILVDLTKTEATLVDRYFGKTEGQAFRSHHETARTEPHA